MTIVTKAELADNLRVSRGRVSQYIKRGLPVRSDGLVDLEVALNWVRRNIQPDCDGRGASAVASSLAMDRLPNGGPPIPPGFGVLKEIKNPADGSMVLGLLVMLQRTPALVAMSAHLAGAERTVAERTGELFMAFYVNAVTEFLAENDVEPFKSNPQKAVWPHPSTYDEVNWAGLGEPGEMARKG